MTEVLDPVALRLAGSASAGIHPAGVRHAGAHPVVAGLAAAPSPRPDALSGAGGLDGALLRDVNAFARDTPWLHGLLSGYATYGVALFAVLLVVGWWTARRDGGPARVAAALWAAAGTLLAVAVNQPVVHAASEERPYRAVPGLLVLASRTADFSFPSDHATVAGAAAAGLFLVSRRLGWTAAIAAALLAFARVYIAAHYPQDVAAGLLEGAAFMLAGWLLLRLPLTALVRALRSTPLRPLVRAAAAESGQPPPGPLPRATSRD